MKSEGFIVGKILDKLAEIEKCTVMLNRMADDATGYIREIEEKLTAASYALTVRGPKITGKYVLGFGKVEGFSERHFVLWDALDDAERLIDAPRMERILAARKMPLLLQKMNEAAKEELEKLKTALNEQEV
jgi:hypothetical protein